MRKNRPHWKELLALAALAAMLTVLAIWADATYPHWLREHPLTANVIASVLSLPLAALLALVVVEEILERGRRRRWAFPMLDEVRSILTELDLIRSQMALLYGGESTTWRTPTMGVIDRILSNDFWGRGDRLKAIRSDASSEPVLDAANTSIAAQRRLADGPLQRIAMEATPDVVTAVAAFQTTVEGWQKKNAVIMEAPARNSKRRRGDVLHPDYDQIEEAVDARASCVNATILLADALRRAIR